MRLRPNLTFSPGLRYEVQTHVHDLTGFGPRLGLTWAPGKNGRTTIRTSYGIFYNWLGTNVYEQTLRVDGVRQREINIENPSFPESGRRRDGQRQQQVRARRHQHGAHPSLQHRDRSHDLAEAARQPDVFDGQLQHSCAA